MAIKGQVIPISLTPNLNKNIDGIERVQVDARNIRFSDTENSVKRPGYTAKWDTSAEFPIMEMIPVGTGYAIDTNGTFYKLGSSITTIHSTSTISRRPQWIRDGNDIIVAYGAGPLVISGNEVTPLANDAPSGWFIASIGTYTIISGHNKTELKWSAPGNPRNWTTASGSGFANIEGTGQNFHMLEHKKRLYFFKETEIEVWGFTGTSSPFRRQTGLTVNVGLGAINSVIKTDDTFYWFGDDGAFYIFDGSNARRLSDGYRKELDKMNNYKELVGFHIRKEKLVMWISPHDGKSFIFDYGHGKWLEDNRWEGGWQSLPFLSYMELNNNQYFGSRGCDGQIYEWSNDYKDDNGKPIRVLRHARIGFSNNNVRINRAQFRRKGGVATSSETTPEMMFRTRFDGGTWVDYENVSTGIEGKYDPYAERRNLGMGRELEIEVTESDATDFILTDIILTVAGLGH